MIIRSVELCVAVGVGGGGVADGNNVDVGEIVLVAGRVKTGVDSISPTGIGINEFVRAIVFEAKKTKVKNKAAINPPMLSP